MMKELPCNPDHNGECLVCDCWLSECALLRLRAGDFKWESLAELLEMYKDYLTQDEIAGLKEKYERTAR